MPTTPALHGRTGRATLQKGHCRGRHVLGGEVCDGCIHYTQGTGLETSQAHTKYRWTDHPSHVLSGSCKTLERRPTARWGPQSYPHWPGARATKACKVRDTSRMQADVGCDVGSDARPLSASRPTCPVREGSLEGTAPGSQMPTTGNSATPITRLSTIIEGVRKGVHHNWFRRHCFSCYVF